VAPLSQGRTVLRSAACLHTNQSRSYLNHLVIRKHPARLLGVLKDDVCGSCRAEDILEEIIQVTCCAVVV
jgi:hypothetical protein